MHLLLAPVRWLMHLIGVPLGWVQRTFGMGGMAAVFLAPNLLVFSVFIVFPIGVNVWYSFTGGAALSAVRAMASCRAPSCVFSAAASRVAVAAPTTTPVLPASLSTTTATALAASVAALSACPLATGSIKV